MNLVKDLKDWSFFKLINRNKGQESQISYPDLLLQLGIDISSDHSKSSNLSWLKSNHTLSPLKLAGSDANGDTAEYDINPYELRVNYEKINGSNESADGFYSQEDGTFHGFGGYKSVKYPISFSDIVYVTTKTDGSATAIAVYYDSNGNYISSEYQGSDGVLTQYIRQILNIPRSTAYVGVTNRSSVEYGFVEKYNMPNNNAWKDKSMVWFGTSIPYEGYPQIIAEMLEAKMYNEAVPSSMVRRGETDQTDGYGWTGLEWYNVANSFSQNLTEKNELINNWNTWKTLLIGNPPNVLEDWDKNAIRDHSYENKLYRHLSSKGGVSRDLYVFDHGHNDNLIEDSDAQFTEVPTSSRDRNTFIGSVNFIIDEILKDNPRAKIVFIGHYEKARKTRISTAQEALADYWNFPLIKLWDLLGWSQQSIQTTGHWVNDTTWASSGGTLESKTQTQIWMYDDLHPKSVEAKLHIAKKIIPFFESI